MTFDQPTLRELQRHLLAYLSVNAVLVAIWALSGLGEFWPGWILFAWGTALAVDVVRKVFPAELLDEPVEA
jgi:2TM domain-containing protein